MLGEIMDDDDIKYNRRGTDSIIISIQHDIKTLLSEQYGIKKQVERTNGRVATLEIWKSFMLGGLAVISLMVVPIIILWFRNHLT
jgi:hypothetical protein